MGMPKWYSNKAFRLCALMHNGMFAANAILERISVDHLAAAALREHLHELGYHPRLAVIIGHRRALEIVHRPVGT